MNAFIQKKRYSCLNDSFASKWAIPAIQRKKTSDSTFKSLSVFHMAPEEIFWFGKAFLLVFSCQYRTGQQELSEYIFTLNFLSGSENLDV